MPESPRRGRRRSGANPEALKNLQHRGALTRLTCGLDVLILEQYFSLDADRERALILQYEALFGTSEAEYLRKAIPGRRGKQRSISGIVAARLLYVVPNYLTETQASEVMRLWPWTSARNGVGYSYLLRICRDDARLAQEIFSSVRGHRLCRPKGGSTPVTPTPVENRAKGEPASIRPMIRIEPPLQTERRVENPITVKQKSSGCLWLAIAIIIGLVLIGIVGGGGGSSAAPSSVPASAATPGPTVWVNTGTGVYHMSGTRWYGGTRNGKYVTEQQALAEGDRPAENHQ